ncbi:MAG: formylmethanofuran dehydrogenase subunit B [Euryarchaeota archaeon]|nr:formylmethanofuran dehydrogenase subunit B [Euryarchaeota archaeon]
MAVCTGCSLLCDDIGLECEDGKISLTKNLCRKGEGRYRSLREDRLVPAVDGAKVGFDEAISRAAEMLGDAEKPLLFGWSNSTLEAQRIGIDLAKKLGATIDDTSSFCQGYLMEKVLRGEYPTCTLDEVRNFADVSIYWGSDPSSSQPRHMSRFSYFPRGEKRQRGYEEDRTAIAIDVRKSPTVVIAADDFFRIPPGGDAEFIEALLAALGGKIPKVKDKKMKKKILNLGSTLRKAEFGVIFPGLGLIYSLKDEIDKLTPLITRLNEVSNYKLIPMVGHYNMRGFNQTLLEETGHINRVSFKDGVEHGPQFAVTEAVNDCDALMVIGSDLISALPAAISRKLARIPTVAIDPHRNLTTDMARVTIPSAISGLEAGGSALRMDGVKVEFEPEIESGYRSDAEILSRIMEAV